MRDLHLPSWFATKLACLLVPCALLASTPALAQGGDDVPRSSAAGESMDVTAEVERLAADGARFVQSGDFEQAVARYLAAYHLAEESALLFNIAFIYDQKLNEPQLALEYYRRYLATPDADPDVATRAIQRRRELQASSSVVAQPAPQPTVAARARSGSGLTGMEVGGYVTGGVGLLSLGTGVAFGALAMGTHDRFEAAEPGGRGALAKTGRNQALTADVFIGLGVAALVTGVVLLWMEPDETEDADVSWLPVSHGGLGGFTFGAGGRF